MLQPELCFEETYVLDRTCGDHMCGDFDRSYGSVSAGREKWPFNVLFF